MQFSAAILALFAASALASPLAKPATVEVGYYPATGCKTGGKTVSVPTTSKCVALDFAAGSLIVAGKTKLPNGCTVKGFQDTKCKSFEDQYIDGPSLGKCDKASQSAGKVKSVLVNCD